MTWGPDLRHEIAELFWPLGACVDRGWLSGLSIDRSFSRLAAMIDRERTDPGYAQQMARQRAAKRAARMALDPEYAAHIKETQRKAKLRWREAHGREEYLAKTREYERRRTQKIADDPEYAERVRARRREATRRSRERASA